MPTIISSKDNELIKSIRKLKDKKYRDQTNEYILEGTKLLQEAIQENVKIKHIIICEDCENNSKSLEQSLLYEMAKFPCYYVTSSVFRSLTEVTTPQGVLAVVEKGDSIEKMDEKEELFVLLDGISDPGNLGTILRTVDSIGLKQVIVSKDTTDCYSPKVVRSSMGAIFRLNIIVSDSLIKTIKNLQKKKIPVIATSLKATKSVYEIKWKKKAIVIGNEANGVSKEVLEAIDTHIKIPMLGKTESLNASVATGIILYEYVRQKIEGGK